MQKRKGKRYWGMTIPQVGILSAMAVMICMIFSIGIALALEPMPTPQPIALRMPTQPLPTHTAINCRSEAAVYFVNLQPLLKQLTTYFDFEKPVEEALPVIEDIKQISAEIRGLPVPACVQPARDTFLTGLDRYIIAVSNLAESKDAAAFKQEESQSVAEIEAGLSQIQALAEGKATPTSIPQVPSSQPLVQPSAVPGKQANSDCDSAEVDLWIAESVPRLKSIDNDMSILNASSIDSYDDFAYFAEQAKRRYYAQLSQETPDCLLGIQEIALEELRLFWKGLEAASVGDEDGMREHLSRLVEISEQVDQALLLSGLTSD